MPQDGKVHATNAPPFATSNGQPAATGGGASGAHDFIKNPLGNAPRTGGRDFTKESRPQSEARREVFGNPQEIPVGGEILKADPGPVSAVVSGDAPGPQPAAPYRLHNPPHSLPAHGMGVGSQAKGGPGNSGSPAADSASSASSASSRSNPFSKSSSSSASRGK
jgi:hypothetical protein